MKKRYKRGILLSTLTTASLLVATQGFGAFTGDHPAVTLRTWNDPAVVTDITAGGSHTTKQNEAYSPRATCGICHNETVDDTTPDGALTDGADEIVGGVQHAQGSYHGGGATKTVVKTQGQENAGDGALEWVSFNTKTYKHGFVESRHAQEGRNEDFGHGIRTAFGAKFTENSPGMFGKY